MSNKYHTSCNPRTITAGKRLAAAFRKQLDIGLDGEPRRRGKKRPKQNEND